MLMVGVGGGEGYDSGRQVGLDMATEEGRGHVTNPCHDANFHSETKNVGKITNLIVKTKMVFKHPTKQRDIFIAILAQK